MPGLPRPHYHPEESDPDWLAAAVQFHGHLGPWATAGLRMGMAARKAAGAEGYFDLAVECRGPLVRPPKSCFLDGLQVSTGATLGKRNLRWIEADELVVRVENTVTGRNVNVRPTAKLLKMLASIRPPAAEKSGAADSSAGEQDHVVLEEIARAIAAAPDRDLLVVSASGGAADSPEDVPR
jgi:formylmethanofuran dehydrogenase subunit E